MGIGICLLFALGKGDWFAGTGICNRKKAKMGMGLMFCKPDDNAEKEASRENYRKHSLFSLDEIFRSCLIEGPGSKSFLLW